METDMLFRQRHSLAHLLAMAVLRLDPGARFGTGPVTEHGFYYDILLSDGVTLSDKDFGKLEKSIRGFIAKKIDFTREEISAEKAREIFRNQPFKLELIEEIIARGEAITIYKTGEPAPSSPAGEFAGFIDLCQGPHVATTGEIDPKSFKLSRVAGAYWKADENNPQLLRISGLAFETEEALAAYLTQQEEAKKRDHRKLGKELDLFTISELVGSGLPLFTPKGSVLRETLSSYSQELQRQNGFQQVWTPHMARTELYKFSGHYDKYPERFEITSSESDDIFMMKPMNCPHHAQLFARKPWSYRDLPVRYMEVTTNYRDEKSGELHGLSRVRSLSQDDGHVFCAEEHIEDELRKLVQIVKKLYDALDMRFYARLSFRDDSDKFNLGDPAMWERAQNIISSVAQKESLETIPGPGEAAFYGPKIDYMVQDSLGREWQCATIQLDFVQPERFDLSYIDRDGSKKRPVMIHKALLGSIERFLSVYIEHTAGNFPLWLAPEQVWVLPIGEAHQSRASEITQALREAGLRAHLHAEDESLGKRIRSAKLQKIPYMVIMGDKEVESQTITLESRDRGNLGSMDIETALTDLLREQSTKSLN